MEPRIRRATVPRHALRGRRRTAGANRSALIRAICAPRRPSTRPPTLPVQNFFRPDRRGAVDIATCKKIRDNGAARGRICAKIKKFDVPETRIPSAFLCCRDFCWRNPTRAKSFAGVRCQTLVSCIACDGRTQELRTNPDTVTVIFFLL
jgi:hypothetical protein